MASISIQIQRAAAGDYRITDDYAGCRITASSEAEAVTRAEELAKGWQAWNHVVSISMTGKEG